VDEHLAHQGARDRVRDLRVVTPPPNGTTGDEAARWIDEYIAALPQHQARALSELRAALVAAAPDALETISYSLPALRLRKKVLVYYAAFKDHLSLFPASGSVMSKLGPELRDHFAGKGTIQFTPDHPLPPAVVEQIVAIRREEIGA
jgi:uncharacterized protein YdhG (YjbR/CyaY superfamily)